MITSLETQTRHTTESTPHKLDLSGSEKRRVNDIKDACATLVDDFQEFSCLVENYLTEVPSRSSDTDRSDCDRFLNWLESRSEMNDEQRDLIVDQQSRHAVEFIALQKRIAHQRFLRLLNEGGPFDKNSAKHLSESVHINPVHVWATFETQALLDGLTRVPAAVLFYSTEEEVLTVVVDSQATSLLKSLEHGSHKLRTLIRQTPKADRESMLETIEQLVNLKIVAVG
ncbi:hypothetical protein N8553_03860 [bacterium]|jgi:hypothetical protein|nr:hypothetical protein [Planctomicrobium sp.]MDA7504096.1 hypothetical protein [bacterium]